MTADNSQPGEETSTAGASRPAGRAPASLTTAIGVLAAQGAALIVVGIWLIYQEATTTAVSATSAATTIGTAFLGAGLFALLAAQLYRRRGWARGPAIVLELLCVPIGWTMIQAGAAVVGVAVLVAGLLGAGLLLTTASREALGIG